MAVKEGNTRIIATIPQKLKDKLDKLCIEDKRTLSKEVEFILEEYINIREQQ